jgi:hypothetical protein
MIVTTAELAPAGWVCDACDGPFQVGDVAHGVIVAVDRDGDPVEGDYVCQTCWQTAAAALGWAG